MLLKDVKPFTEKGLLDFTKLYHCYERNQEIEETGDIDVIYGDDDLSKLFATALKGVDDAPRAEDKP